MDTISKCFDDNNNEANNGNENIINLEPGSWMIFENSLCEHQAFSSLECSGRPTIEIDVFDHTRRSAGARWAPAIPPIDRNLTV